jgi:phosphoglycerate dehydrogenase-like enzyme
MTRVAVLDDYQNEPLPLDHPLRQLDNIVIMPHLVCHPGDLSHLL